MPYIKKQQREQLKTRLPENAGEFNYLVSMLAKQYIDLKGECYQTYNDLLGALEGIKLELYRRQVSDYENQKLNENGDLK